jgi:hypothetical protein
VSEVADADAGMRLIDVLDSAAVVVVIVAGVAFLVFVAIPLVLVVVDLVIALVLTALGIAARLLFRRWTVEAVSEAGDRHRWRVVGRRASRDHAADVANALAHGNPLPSGEVPSRPPIDGATSASS